MAGNSTGEIFRLTTFGESHGPAIGGIVEGCPAGLPLNLEAIQDLLDKRRPGQSDISSPRRETDQVEILSGVFEGKTLGTPIGFIIPNRDARPQDYDMMKDVMRPSHADYTWLTKFGHRDHRGGGRSSARETACRVVGGAIALQLIGHYNIEVNAWVSAVGNIEMKHNEDVNTELIYTNDVRCPDPEAAESMKAAISKARGEGNSLGGMITCSVTGTPAGLGEPVFDKLHADLGKSMLNINAVKGVEFGSGFASATMMGSEHNDAFVNMQGTITTTTNYSGGIQGGISNGNNILFRVAFKPVATIAIQQQTINTKGESVLLEATGRHDPCVVPRAVPIVRAMTALTLADHLLRNRLSKL